MSRQVELEGNTLCVQTRYLRDNPNITRVVVKYTGEKTKVFNDDWKGDIMEAFVFGYKIKDLIVLAEDIKDRGISNINLKAYNENYLAGYKKAYDEINNQIQQSIDRTLSEIQEKP